MRSLHLAGGLVLVLLLAGCSSFRVSSDWDRTVDFGRYRTYAWAPTSKEGQKYAGQYDLLDKRIRRAIDDEMEYKGLERAASRGSADLLVVYRLNTRNRTQIYRDYYYWGGGYSAYQYTEGSLAIQIVDAKQESVVWEGIGTDVVGRGGDPDEKMQEAVIRIMDSFPPEYD
jgi:hypothetical protein